MNSSVLIGNNPFFLHDLDKLCGICHRQLSINQKEQYKFHDNLPTSKNITILEALKRFSEFSENTISKGPQNICKTCYGNTIAAFKFHTIWSKTVSYLEDYLAHQEMLSKDIPTEITEEDEVELIKPEPYELPASAVNNKASEYTQIKVENMQNAKNIRKKLVKCKFCDKSYDQSNISNHRRIHTGEKPHSCKICDKKFIQRSTLKRHEATHGEERPYLCKFCGKGFKSQSDLCKHEKIHNVERPHKCEICNKGFTVLRTLKDHYSVHSEEKNFTCEVCAKSFGTRKHLRQHMITHELVKRHVCHLCEKRFTQAHSLRTHLLKYCKGSN